jgi:uncharacterized protein YjbI with pentapeptide repeats
MCRRRCCAASNKKPDATAAGTDAEPRPATDVQAALTVLGRLPQRPNVSRGDLTSAQVAGAQLGGADLSGAQLAEVNLTHAQLVEADLSGARLGKANLLGARLSRRICRASSSSGRT